MNIYEEELGHEGRMISASKGRYRHENVDHLVVFNGNLIVDNKKVWYGDIDLTEDYYKLQRISNRTGKEIFLVSEMDGRFENEKSPKIGNYIARIDGYLVNLGPDYKDMYNLAWHQQPILKKKYRPKKFNAKDACKVHHASDIDKFHVIDQLPLTRAKAHENPFELMGKAAKDKWGDKVESVSDVGVHPQTAIQMNLDFVTYLKSEGITGDYEIQKNLSWGILCQAPRYVAGPSVKKGVLYLLKDKRKKTNGVS